MRPGPNRGNAKSLGICQLYVGYHTDVTVTLLSRGWRSRYDALSDLGRVGITIAGLEGTDDVIVFIVSMKSCEREVFAFGCYSAIVTCLPCVRIPSPWFSISVRPHRDHGFAGQPLTHHHTTKYS